MVQGGWVAARRLWQGRKDSNPRMSESKSDALTNLATPQLFDASLVLLLFVDPGILEIWRVRQKLKHRVPIQSARNATAHAFREFQNDRPGLAFR